MAKTQAELAAEQILGGFWLAQVERVARYALENGGSFTLYPPTPDDYKRATVLCEVLATPPVSELAIAAPEPKASTRKRPHQ